MLVPWSNSESKGGSGLSPRDTYRIVGFFRQSLPLSKSEKGNH